MKGGLKKQTSYSCNTVYSSCNVIISILPPNPSRFTLMSMAATWSELQTLGEANSRHFFIVLASSFDQVPISKTRVVSDAGGSINSIEIVSPEYSFISGAQVLPMSSKHNVNEDSFRMSITCIGSQEKNIESITIPKMERLTHGVRE